ncbi:E3 ubiquitin-protein ligase TRIM13-like isoform X4 [Macrobrachium rosenbergii]|uniref:E3 ubiquitin-protein ligase TRIM13-like isoform X4 n=1 Tax=Macrobrachium rosenbergii TaxID=79674 RepID=UPI0034D41BEE
MLLAARRLEAGGRRLEKASGKHRRAMAAAASSSFSMSSLESNPLECKICYNLYSEDHCPRILPCSHEFCGRCIKGLISTQMKFCTVCHEEFAANSAEDLMISRGLLDAAKQLSSPHIRQNLTKTKNPKKVFLKTKRFRKNITKGCIDVCQGAEAEVKGLIESSRKLRRAVVVVKLGSSKTLENIDLHIQLLENKLATIQRNTLSIKASYSQLKAATDFTSTNVLMKETTEFLQAIEETVTKFQKDKKEQYHIKKEMLRMKGELENSVTDPEEQQNEERDSVVNITVSSWSLFLRRKPKH